MVNRKIIPSDCNIGSGNTQITPTSGGNYAVQVTVSDLNSIDYILNVSIDTDPLQDPGTPVGQVISGNSVGMTLASVSTGGTISVKVDAFGE